MKKFFLVSVLFLLPSSVFAQSSYAELSLGASFPLTVDTKDYTFEDSEDIYSVHGELDIDGSLIVGAEYGFTGFMEGSWRGGISYEYLKLELDSAEISGTINDVPFSEKVGASEVRGYGIDPDNAVHLVMGNIYYNLPLMADNFRPYVGVGAGIASIEHADTQFALSATAGFRMGINEYSYFGFRYRLYRVEGPTNDFHIDFDPVYANTISALIGFYF